MGQSRSFHTYIKEIHGHVNIDMYALFEAVYQKYKNISE